MKREFIPYNKNLPAVVLSLDFEMRWGLYDILGSDKDAYRESLENVREIVPALLKQFHSRNIRATWAAVGALACKNWNEYFSRVPEPPNYKNPVLRITPEYAEVDPEGSLHFAPDLLQSIITIPGQELGSHTFSHMYMREPGITVQDVEADLLAVNNLWKDRSYSVPTSLVFPRNQSAFIDCFLSSSIGIWRGNEKPWFYECNNSATNKLLPRGFRLVDSLNPFVSRAYPLEENMTRSSLFLRINLPDVAWNLHLSRIKNELEGLRPGEIFHLWWHPHNLGRNTQNRLDRVERVLDLIAKHCRENKITSLCMGDLIH